MSQTKQQTKQRILQTAMRLFHTQGYHATGVSQILKESVSPKGSLYYHFPGGKEQLAIEAIEQSTVIIATAMKSDLDFYDDIYTAFSHHLTSIATKFEDFDKTDDFSTIPFGLIASETALVNENIRKSCEKTYTTLEAIYEQRLLAAGYTSEEALILSSTFNILVEGAVALCVTSKSNAPLLNVKKVIPLLLKRAK
ncbi:TetR/AcrR family transcriptional regulator [Brochothrix thermosphacta]|uniref:TetR/AcrR family transcriptional regulator n=1 Tax=Brochothrix thermosphacta TaxID=2756 RepID=UPI00083FA4E2|nr:TetR/AcrR family transcriptional regulator [Brochothrix thermosphacta]ODJ62726.1 TetR family transcriptional regulator [Brochothrix thermosphacta]ODJ66458.1 TetR family transcriptional regulator [Brochothrix thermosphacta]SPN71176.1 transcriptional repressor of lmrAB [Brochothrix thermosphacta]